MNELLNQIDWTAVSQQAMTWSGKLLLALLLFWVGKWLARRISKLVGGLVERTSKDSMLAGFVRNLVFGLGVAIVVVAALDQLGVPNASLLTALGAAGLAIGLSLQGSLSNLASGVLLILFRPFRSGDFVEVGGVSGSVDNLSLLFTVLITGDNRQVTMPNSQVMSSPIINFSARDQRRIDLVIGIGYQHQAEQAIDIIRDVVASTEGVLQDPEPVYMLMNLGESSVDIAVRPWSKTSVYWPTRSRLLIRIKAALDEAGIEIPFPQRSVHWVGKPAASAAD
ncbi:mechanosensitive ion channel family protein [Pseudomarimonas arenosa]|uniref:Small-conductance mechanosensitive channel n=1 Tax=Pseudomarimonas arenosa TaxID=2774145 RepID=A0AAW3ZRM7_9GAMM|nr:mechanosensitive ion channel domain-containing protein [Pseudomarimonas arenosa]MBD8527732.1 mechanosensitive ion channel [Pseudomarimonas arenosa]